MQLLDPTGRRAGVERAGSATLFQRHLEFGLLACMITILMCSAMLPLRWRSSIISE
jgi:hypothetical protein